METNESTSAVQNNSQRSEEHAIAVVNRPAGWKSPYKERTQPEQAPAPVHEVPAAIAESFEPLPPTESFPAPEAATPAEESQQIEQTQPPKRRRGLVLGGVAAGLGVVVAGGLVIGLGANKNNSADVTQPGSTGQPIDNPAASGLPQPGATEAAAPSQAAPEAVAPQTFNVKTISASQSQGAIAGQVLSEVVDGWRDAGIPMNGDNPDNKQLAAMQQQSGKSPDVYAASVAQQAVTTFGNTLFIDGWENRSDIQAYVQEIEPMNEKNLFLSIKTANDPQTFFWGIENDNQLKPEATVTEDAGSELDLSITYQDINNVSQDPNAATLAPDLASTPSRPERLDVKLLNVNGVMKISAITKIDLPLP